MHVDELTIVLPSFNEERRLPLALERALAWRDARLGEIARIDVLVVDDGSDDGTAALVQRDFDGRVRLIRRPRRGGKGAAVRTGVEAVQTRWTCFADADGSIPFDEIGALLAHADRAPLVIGSKRAPGSEIHYPLSRRILGAAGQRLIALCLVRGFHDTQCGLKLLRTDVARELFRAGTIDGFGFDFELLYLARRLGHRVVEVPIRCEHRIGGTIRASTYLAVLGQLARVTRNRIAGTYPRRSAAAAPSASAAPAPAAVPGPPAAAAASAARAD